MAAFHEMDLADKLSVANDFIHYEVEEAVALKMHTVRNMAKNFAEMLMNEVPICAERTEALKKIEEAMMWANAGISRNQ